MTIRAISSSSVVALVPESDGDTGLEWNGGNVPLLAALGREVPEPPLHPQPRRSCGAASLRAPGPAVQRREIKIATVGPEGLAQIRSLDLGAI